MPRRKSTTPDPDAPGFEQAVAELETIVAALEEESLPLEEMVRRFEQGTRLLRHCEEVLGSARKRLKTIATRGPVDGDGAEIPLTPEAPEDTDAPEDDDDIRLF